MASELSTYEIYSQEREKIEDTPEVIKQVKEKILYSIDYMENVGALENPRILMYGSAVWEPRRPTDVDLMIVYDDVNPEFVQSTTIPGGEMPIQEIDWVETNLMGYPCYTTTYIPMPDIVLDKSFEASMAMKAKVADLQDNFAMENDGIFDLMLINKKTFDKYKNMSEEDSQKINIETLAHYAFKTSDIREIALKENHEQMDKLNELLNAIDAIPYLTAWSMELDPRKIGYLHFKTMEEKGANQPDSSFEHNELEAEESPEEAAAVAVNVGILAAQDQLNTFIDALKKLDNSKAEQLSKLMESYPNNPTNDKKILRAITAASQILILELEKSCSNGVTAKAVKHVSKKIRTSLACCNLGINSIQAIIAQEPIQIYGKDIETKGVKRDTEYLK